MSDPSATPLTNQDFRNLLSTPRADRSAPSTPSGFAKPSTPRGPRPDQGGDKSKNAKRPHKPFKPKEVAKGEGDEEEDANKYRDRAEERRRGVNPDYEGANQLASVLTTGDINISRLSVEETKYLGGDIDHTHLVKGLDYALLQKERARLEEEEAKLAAQKKGSGASASASAAEGGARGPIRREDIKPSTPLARSIVETMFFPHKVDVREMYMPRRMAFVFEFENEEEVFDSDVPTTLRRSKADCPQPPEAVFAGIDTAVLERIAKVMSYIKTTGGKKMRKKERDEMLGAGGIAGDRPEDASHASAGNAGRAAAAHGAKKFPAAPEAEEDIFGDAGTDYKPSVSKKKDPLAARTAGASHEADMELGNGSESASLGVALPPGVAPGSAAAYAAAAAAYAYPLPPPPSHHASGGAGDYGGQGGYAYAQQQQGEGYYGGSNDAAATAAAAAAAAEAERWRVRAKRTEEKEVDFEESAYAECYPMQAGFVAEVVDSDDEDLSQMDGTGKGGKSRYDFETEDEWQRYKETREQAPKAAFQFGVKAGDGRKGGKEMARDQKLSSQLGKIEKLLKDKGKDHSGAFAKDAGHAGTPRRGGGTTPRHTGDDPNLNVASMKRQRI